MTATEFEILSRSLHRRLHGEAFRMVGNIADADDMVQDAMLKLWSLRHRLDELQSVEAFALVVVRRQCINLLRRRHPDVETDNVLYAMPAAGTPEDELILAESRRVADRVLSSLPPAQQTLLQLRHVDGLDNAAIAALLGSSEGAVRTALCRARRRVAELFKIESQR